MSFEVAQITGTSREEAGFLDSRGIEHGDSWLDALSAEVATCRSFVPVFAPAYFQSEYCGKEWAAFEQRLEGLEEATRSRLVRPVLLLAPHTLGAMPAAATRIQYTDDAYPEVYTEEGLRYLLKLSGHRDDFETFVHEFARKLVAQVAATPLPEKAEVPSLADVESSFHRSGTRLSDTAAGSPAAGPHYVQFVYVAARREELHHVRSALDAYGTAGGLDWQPYHPAFPEAIGVIAQRVAADEGLFYESVPLDEHLPQRLDDAVAQRKIVAVVVDPWTVELEEYRALMRKLDESGRMNDVVFVPWNGHDPETASRLAELEQAIAVAFANRRARQDPDALVDATSAEHLQAELSTRLTRARQKIIDAEQMASRAPGSTAAPVLRATITSD